MPKGSRLEELAFEAAHDHSACVREALSAAAAICEERGARLTPVRRRVLELVWSSHQAVKAYDLMAQMQGEMAQAAKPPTVYRALDFLMEHGLVHRVDSLNAYVGCPTPRRAHREQLLICTECGAVGEMEDPAVANALGEAASRAGFSVQRQTVELQGLCGACQSA